MPGTEMDALLATIVAQAAHVRDAADPEQTLRHLLEPVRELFLRVAAERDAANAAVVTATTVNAAARLKAQNYWSEAATRIQAAVRGKNQRGMLQRSLSFHLQGTKVLNKYVLKRDRFPNCHILDTPDGDHAPNFRRLDGTPLYGTAQPTVEGIKQILCRVAADGFSHVVWVNLREEAVIYVNGTPFTARRSAKLNENDLVPGITGHTVEVLESSMKKSLQEQLLTSPAHQLEYWNEATLHENELLAMDHVDPGSVHTLSELYELDEVRKCSGTLQSVRYYRIPIERENAPEHADVEKLMELIHSATPIVKTATSDTAFVFNCQMGKRRTTTALVIGSLIWQRPQIQTQLQSAPPSPARRAKRPSVVTNGNFNVIRELEKRLPFGRQAKQWVDTTVDQCAAICNIRTVIHEYHELSISEAKPLKRSYYLHHALSFLERYFYLIVFGAYMLAIQQQHEQRLLQSVTGKPRSSPSPSSSPRGAHSRKNGGGATTTLHSFSKWLQHHPNLFRLLDDMGGVKYNSDKVLQNAVLKFDHFPGIARIPFVLSQAVPNFRQIAQQPIFGTAQCLEQGIKDVAIHAMALGYDRAVWINLREEALVYVTGRPFVMRHATNLMENVEYPGIEVDEIVAIEQQVKDEIQSRVRKADGLFLYWYEPRELVSEEKIDHIDPEIEIKTLHEIYDEVADATGFELRYARIPVSDETAPEEKDLDDLVRLVVPVFAEELRIGDFGQSQQQQQQPSDAYAKPVRTAVICNCQMGRGRTTTALVCTFMLRLVLEDVQLKSTAATPAGMEPARAAAASSQRSSSTLDRIFARGTTAPLAANETEDDQELRLRRQSSMAAGEFVVIRKLCETLSNGAQAKTLVDFAVDQCDHLQNLRECIAQCRDLAMDRELSSSKHDFYMLRAVNYLERYFYLICFAAYLLEQRGALCRRRRADSSTSNPPTPSIATETSVLFVAWMNERHGSALYALLDNLCFEEELGAAIHVSSMRWRWRRKRKLISRLE